MRSPRLLPVVIFAVAALLLFKGIGLLTAGGYVLTGTQPAQAAETSSTDATAQSDATAQPDAGQPAPGDAADPSAGLTATDTSPTITDSAPSVPGLGAAPAAVDTPVPPQQAASPAATPAPLSAAANSATGGLVPLCPVDGGPVGGKPQQPGVNCDALPTGASIPPGGPDANPTEKVLIQRLTQRSDELDRLAGALDMREALVKAAERQMQERADALKTLQGQIAALQDQKKAAEDAQFGAVVKMYETMKPQEAAAIFDGLDMGVLIRVAQAMDPRKMSPILAKMNADRAQQLTLQLADNGNPEADPAAAASDPGALPQIVGH